MQGAGVRGRRREKQQRDTRAPRRKQVSSERGWGSTALTDIGDPTARQL